MKDSTVIGLAILSLAVTALAGNEPAILPAPQKMTVQEGVFKLSSSTKIHADPAAAAAAEILAARLRTAAGFDFQVDDKVAAGSGIVLKSLKPGGDVATGAEGYLLEATKDEVVIRATSAAGLFYGAQTLLQILPPEIFSPHKVKGVKWTIPCVTIEDSPRFPWRGLMLDVSRHFFTKDEVKRYLDVMAMHKLNVFHWHLTDDQGWRIEIKKYPELTQIGAWRNGIGFGMNPTDSTAYGKDGRYGGFYTQDEIREVVAYAAKLHITVVPEIEMPGHASAVLAAYPQFVCPNVKVSAMPNKGGVFHGIYCAGNDAAYSFIEDVLTEVAALFLGKYIHIGGDECPKDNWKTCEKCQARIKAEGLKNEHELQSYFIRRVEKIISAKGRSLIGWSEIREGGLAESAALMDWIGGGAESAASGHDVVMSPTSHCYLDYYQAKGKNEPRAIGGFVPLQKVYSFEPMPGKLAPELQRHILGGQANLWTEYIANFPHLQYMTFPRACALAEVVWSPVDQRNYSQFISRLGTHLKRLDALKVNYRKLDIPPVGEWKASQIKAEAAPLEWDVTAAVKAVGSYSAAFSYTHGVHGIDIVGVALLEDGKEISRDGHAGFAGGQPRQPAYTLAVPEIKQGARYTLRAQVAGNGGTDSNGQVVFNFVSNSAPLKTK